MILVVLKSKVVLVVYIFITVLFGQEGGNCQLSLTRPQTASASSFDASSTIAPPLVGILFHDAPVSVVDTMNGGADARRRTITFYTFVGVLLRHS